MKITPFFILVVTGVFLGILTTNAWTVPVLPAPTTNMPPVLHTGGGIQDKQGRLSVNSLKVYGSFVLQNGSQAENYVLQSDSTGKGTWVPATMFDTGATIKLSQGTGIILTPNPITSTGQIKVDTNYLQKRVTGTCSGGVINSISVTGTVTCSSAP